MKETPLVLFVCTQNAGRSQMAAALLEDAAAGRLEVRSAGTDPAGALHPEVLDAMREIGLDLAGRDPRALIDSDIREADVVVTMGCGDACPIYPGKRYEDWELEDPAGKPLEKVRAIRDSIRRRAGALAEELLG